MTDWMRRFGTRLLRVTRECRPDMHEPDEQGVKAVVTGNHLDNAMGDSVAGSCGEFVVTIHRDGSKSESFNLASLIALARIGADAQRRAT